MIDKNKLKKELITINDVHRLVQDLGGNPRPVKDGVFVSQTICHNEVGVGSYKLYYYNNSTLFHCYSGCEKETFDIYELVQKVKSRETGNDWSLPKCVKFVANYFGFEDNFEKTNNKKLADWAVLSRYNHDDEDDERIVEMKIYPDKILRNLPLPHIRPWEDEGITYEVCKYCNIAYEPASCCIIIPHYDDMGNLVGIRQRTLIEEDANIYGKYRPARINGVLYNHPLSFALYGLNWCKSNICSFRQAILFESEKSVLKYMSYFGTDNSIACAVCGSSISAHQMSLLEKYGVTDVAVALDMESDEQSKRAWVKKFYNIQNKFGNKFNISFIYDKDREFLGFKDSPIDRGKDVFLELYKRRIYI